MPAGPHRPNHRMNSKPGTPDSAMVGTFGSWLARLADVIASARSLPDWMNGSPAEIGEK